MSALLQTVAEQCLKVEGARSESTVRDALKVAAAAFGATFYLFGIRTGRSVRPPQQIVISDYPKAWRKYYDDNGAHAFDPVINKAFQFEGTFRWDGLHHDERQMALRRESVRNGMEYGFSCSDRGADGSMAILSFCGNHPIAPDLALWEQVSDSAVLLASVTNKAVTKIIAARTRAFGEALSEAERKSLQLVAGGATAKQVAHALGVKPRTVRYYLDRAAEKLGARSRKEAVIKAVADGIIDPRPFPRAGFRQESDLEE